MAINKIDFVHLHVFRFLEKKYETVHFGSEKQSCVLRTRTSVIGILINIPITDERVRNTQLCFSEPKCTVPYFFQQNFTA